MAKIRIRGRRVYIGSGKSFEAACRLKDAAERICFGKFRRQEEFPVVEG